MTGKLTHSVIGAMAEAMIAHADELTRLDQAIGDGDHGVNMKRGFTAVLADLDTISSKSLSQALIAVGTTLVMKVGGASGPLYGTLFLQLGKALPETPTLHDVAAASQAAVSAVKARGKSDSGSKTMLDVLDPVLGALQQGLADPASLPRTLKQTAQAAAEATVPMRAVRGRAAFLGERSIGHLDPGAHSCALLIAAACGAVEAIR